MSDTKETNPKDAIDVKKGRSYQSIPATVVREVSLAMMDGAMKYGRHNYRVSGIRASVYYDAAKNHLDDYWEGEDIDPDSGLSHVTKAIASLFVLRDAMINDMITDDRPPSPKLAEHRIFLQKVADRMFERHPEPVAANIKE